MVKTGRTKIKESFAKIQGFSNYLELAKRFLEHQPLFYDKSKMWWIWNKQEYKYEKTDDIDIMNAIDDNLAYNTGETVKSHVKREIIESLKRIGRKKKPKEQKDSWIQFKNIIVDFETGETFKASPKYFMTNPIPYEIGETEDTPTIDKLFKEWVVAEGIQDETYINTLYETLAYGCCSKQFLQRLIALTGSGSNGKGCFLRLIAQFLGSENICSSELKILAGNNFESSALYKKQACFMNDVDNYDLSNTVLLKKLTGEDDIRYEFKGKTSFSEQSSTTCYISTNSLPVTPDRSKGFYRRWLIIDFPHEFKVGKDVIGMIPEVEYNNLAKKVIRILKELLEKGGFTNEGDIESRMKRYEERSNPLINFIEAKTEENIEYSTVLQNFCKEFNVYLKENRLRQMTPRVISKALKEEGYQVKGKRIDFFDKQVHTTCIWGLKLLSEKEEK